MAVEGDLYSVKDLNDSSGRILSCCTFCVEFAMKRHLKSGDFCQFPEGTVIVYVIFKWFSLDCYFGWGCFSGWSVFVLQQSEAYNTGGEFACRGMCSHNVWTRVCALQILQLLWCFGAGLYSMGTLHEHLHQRVTTASGVTYFIPWANTGCVHCGM